MKVKVKSPSLRLLLARKNMSQNCFARRVGVTSGYMAQLMSGLRNPSPKLREAMLMELKKDEAHFDEFFEILGSAE